PPLATAARDGPNRTLQSACSSSGGASRSSSATATGSKPNGSNSSISAATGVKPNSSTSTSDTEDAGAIGSAGLVALAPLVARISSSLASIAPSTGGVDC